MITNNSTSIPPELETLVASDKTSEDSGETAVAPCPYAKKVAEKKKEEEKPKEALRILLWNIHQLGGGFHRPAERPAYVIEAYATLIHKLNIDIVVLVGITSTIGSVAKVSGKTASGRTQLVMTEEVKDTGVAEINRILEKLKSLDSGGGWQAEFLKPSGKEGYVYLFGTTTCILYRSSKQITFSKLDVIDSDLKPTLGLTGKLLCASFQASKQCADPVYIMAPLGTIDPRDLNKGEIFALPEDAPKQSRTAPESKVFAVSAPINLLADRGAFNELRASVDALYQLPSKEGSVLHEDFWKSVAEQQPGLLANFAAMGLDDVLLQNEHMHWEAMEMPKHAKVLDEVTGVLADTLLVCTASPTGQPKIEELRIVDLVRATLSAETLKALDKSAPPPNELSLPREDSVLSSLRKDFRAGRKAPEPKADLVNALAEGRYLGLALSTHWPVVLQLRWP